MTTQKRLDEFETRVFDMLWNLTDNYRDGDGPSCKDTAERIRRLASDMLLSSVKSADAQKDWESRG
jgi:hypothetical protein